MTITKSRREQGTAHPATFRTALLEVFADILGEHVDRQFTEDGFPVYLLDPFAGTGKIHDLADQIGCGSIGVELEPEWAAMHEGTIVGDATTITLDAIERGAGGGFDHVVTSPAYGNRMADKHDAKDGSDRATYKHRLGRDLDPNNSGGMQWGDEYRALHLAAWKNIVGMLPIGGMFVLNVKDHVRNGQRMPVSAWHLRALLDLGLTFLDDASIPTKGLGQSVGANAATRVGVEHVYVLVNEVAS